MGGNRDLVLIRVIHPGKTAVCETLREFDVEFPQGYKFRVKCADLGMIELCGSKCNCWVGEDSTRFLDRVAAAFPNVRYQILEERRVKMLQ